MMDEANKMLEEAQRLEDENPFQNSTAIRKRRKQAEDRKPDDRIHDAQPVDGRRRRGDRVGGEIGRELGHVRILWPIDGGAVDDEGDAVGDKGQLANEAESSVVDCALVQRAQKHHQAKRDVEWRRGLGGGERAAAGHAGRHEDGQDPRRYLRHEVASNEPRVFTHDIGSAVLCFCDGRDLEKIERRDVEAEDGALLRAGGGGTTSRLRGGGGGTSSHLR